MLNRSRSVQEINKHVSDGIDKNRENQRSEELHQIRSQDGGCHGHTAAHDFNHREGKGQEPYILAEGDRHTELEQRHGSAHHEEDLNVNSLQQTVSMMRRTTEQITDVSCGNTAALVGIGQFL